MLTLLAHERSFEPETEAQSWAAAIAVIVGISSPALLCGMESVIAGSPGMRLAASARSLSDFLSACARISRGVAVVNPFPAQHSIREFLDACRLGAPDVRIVLMTNEHQPHTVREAVRCGAAGLVDMTASADVIRAAISAAANGQRYIAPSIACHLADSIALEDMTKREMDVLRLLARGRSNKSIAKELDVTVGTVKTHVGAIMGKLRSSSRTGAVLEAYRLGLVGLER